MRRERRVTQLRNFFSMNNYVHAIFKIFFKVILYIDDELLLVYLNTFY